MTTEPPAILPLVADPIRWRLLSELARSDRRVGELTRLVDKPQNLVSYHLRELRDAGVVSARRSSADRRDIYYRAELLRVRELLGGASGAMHPGLQLTSAPASGSVLRRPQPRVLFLCSGNSARSQIAEALLVYRSGFTIEARSAGITPKPLHPNAVRVLGERGIDITGNRTKHVSRFERSRFDRVITVCDRAREVCPELPGAPESAHWSIGDPSIEGDTDEATYPAFERVAAELDERISLLIADLIVHPSERNRHGR